MCVRRLLCAAFLLLCLAVPVEAKLGDPIASFANSSLVFQLLLTPQGQSELTGQFVGWVAYRYISDDRTITVDLVVRGGVIEQQIMYLPMDMQRGYQVSMFLQDAVGSVVGAQKGMIAYRAAVNNRKETYLPWGPYQMRFTPLERNLLRVLVTQ